LSYFQTMWKKLPHDLIHVVIAAMASPVSYW
jgi:hypothetical protein